MAHYGLLQILKANGKITTQDLGRNGWLHLGICESGAADELAYMWANHLVGNTPFSRKVKGSAPKGNGPCTIEITLGQATFLFTAPTTAALTGANVAAFLNDKPLASWQNFRVVAGDVLRLAMPTCGLVNYLAVQGGFRVRSVCGSTSICEREATGPFMGKALALGQCVGYCESVFPIRRRSVVSTYTSQYKTYTAGGAIAQPAAIPFIAAAINHSLSSADYLEFKAIAAQFCAQTYTLGSAVNRMGCRLLGRSLVVNEAANKACASAGMPYGAVQLPPDGQPIVLLKDRQTMGGYPVLGCLSRLGAARLAQFRPGEQVTFVPVTRLQALLQLREYYSFFGVLPAGPSS
jgi:biotin-dependent carboxylase-like uncharacterized protein